MALSLLALLSGAPGARAQSVDFASLINYLPSIGLDGNTEGALTANLLQALQSYDQAMECDAASILGDGVGLIQALRNPIGAAAADDLFLRFWRLRHAILASLPQGVTCPGFEAIGAFPSLELSQNDATKVSGEIHFGAANLSGVNQDAAVWMRVEMAGLEGREGEVGLPAIPVYRRLVAVPRGASVSVTLDQPPEVAHVLAMKLAPFIRAEHDEEGIELEIPVDLAPDATVYGEHTYSPAEVVRVIATTRLRDLDVAVLEVASGQFNPIQEEVRLFERVSWTIQFSGGDGTFVPNRGPFESAGSLYDTTLNRDALDYFSLENESPVSVPLGEEFLILTHPDFLAEANLLADWKNSRGIPTNVFSVGQGTDRETPGEIRDLIWDHLLNALTPPSYVLLVGDVDRVPTWIIPRELPCTQDSVVVDCAIANPLDSDTATDLPYVMSVPFLAIPLPSASIGRIPVVVQGDFETIVIDSIIPYEQAQLSSDPIHQTVSLVTSSLCLGPQKEHVGTAFTRNAEEFATTLGAAGKDIDRIYQLQCDFESPGPSPTPTHFKDTYGMLSPLPDAIGPASGFNWDGDAAQFIDALTEGRLFATYLGHSSPNGLAHPPVTTADIVNQLTRFSTPPTVVHSLGCGSGRFDAGFGPTSFAEQLLYRGHAVAVVAASRNVGLGKGLMDGMLDASWPEHNPSYGSSTSLTRIGDIFNYGQAYWGVGRAMNDPKTFDSLHRRNLFGDPTLELPVASTLALEANRSAEYTTSDGIMSVTYPVEGAIISALQRGPGGVIPLGRAKVSNGAARLDLVNDVQQGLPVWLAASVPGGGSVALNRTTEVPSLSSWGLAGLAAFLVAVAAVRWRPRVPRCGAFRSSTR